MMKYVMLLLLSIGVHGYGMYSVQLLARQVSNINRGYIRSSLYGKRYCSGQKNSHEGFSGVIGEENKKSGTRQRDNIEKLVSENVSPSTSWSFYAAYIKAQEDEKQDASHCYQYSRVAKIIAQQKQFNPKSCIRYLPFAPEILAEYYISHSLLNKSGTHLICILQAKDKNSHLPPLNEEFFIGDLLDASDN